jgi:PAS domain S-box-containing protein
MTTPAVAGATEAARRRALDALDLFDAAPEEALDRVARLAARLLDAPIALVVILDGRRQRIRSLIGATPADLPEEIAFCDHAIGGDRPLIVGDARRDPRFADCPTVRDGGIRFYAGAPLLTAEGQCVGALCVMDRVPRPEITAEDGEHLARLAALALNEVELRAVKRQLSEELSSRRLAERQAAILDALPAHVALLDHSGRILSVSRSWHDFAAANGLSGTATVGGSYFDFCAASAWGDHGKAIATGLNAVLAGGLTQYSIDYPSDEGALRRWYRLMAAPLALGRTGGAVVMHLDVTSSKLAEEALRREKEFSEFLIKTSMEGILVFDRAFRITLWNPGMERITGAAAEQLLGRKVFQALPSLAGTDSEGAMRDTLDGRETSLYDQRYRIEDSGREGFFEAYFAPLYSRGRKVVGGIGFLRDTTERRRIEDALRQSQKMEAVGQLTGGIAHDFNNMLTVIAGNLELLEGKLTDQPRLLRLVNTATLAASRAEKLTQQLLTFSRRQQLRPQAIDFNQIVIGMDDLLRRTVGENVDIQKQLGPEIWPALADPNQIETALLNLVLNARDAIRPSGQITIETANAEISVAQGDLAPGAYATLAVIDTGQGMSEDVLARVFEPFFTTKEVGKGTGLGLAQVYGFVKQSAGHVKIESRLGHGTTVRLYLPRAHGVASVAAATPPRGQQSHGEETVLVVEDDHGVRDFAVSVLRELGYRVLEAASGDTAMQLISASPDIDLLFTDVVMPGALNGADLARAALKRRPQLRVLFTSGYTTRLVEKDWPTTVVDLLRKPYRSIDLAQRVREVLDRTPVAK